MSRPRSNSTSPVPCDDSGVRAAAPADLDAINRVVEAAMATWDISARVRRLSLPLYRYGVEDFEFLELLVAKPDDVVHGVAALEPLGGADALLHGLYVLPQRHRGGIGSRLLGCAEGLALRRRFDGLRVRARPESADFFIANGYRRITRVEDSSNYPWLMYKPLAASRP